MQNTTFDYETEFSTLSFGDKRLNHRFIKTMNTCTHDCSSSFLSSTGDRHQAKAIYRMFSNESFQSDLILEAHRDSTVKRVLSSDEKIILAVQDTTSLNYDTHKKTKGLGCIDRLNTLGLLVHSTLAVTTEGLVLGLLDQKIWTRPIKEKGTNLTKGERNWLIEKKPIEEKESYNWITSMNYSIIDESKEMKVIHVCDREGDIYELFANAQNNNKYFLIRAAYSRNCNEDETFRTSHHSYSKRFKKWRESKRMYAGN